MNYPGVSGRGIHAMIECPKGRGLKLKAAQLTTDHTDHTEKRLLRR
ncbi:MAG: hypothetical protein HOC24_09930 [Deltaproteobacteria bacterium]|jgi:hypothetical protein|nr:hypothetical protein [Deltaproteobacteria bacterium]